MEARNGQKQQSQPTTRLPRRAWGRPCRWFSTLLGRGLLLLSWLFGTALAHPLGNFTVSHFSRIETQAEEIRLHYVVDYAEIAAFPELQSMDANRDGVYAPAEKQAWLARQLSQWQAGLRLTANGQPLPWRMERQMLTLVPGAVNLFTLRCEADLVAPLRTNIGAAPVQFTLTDTNHSDRQGWHEIVLQPVPGVALFDSSTFGDSLSDELRSYPEDRSPLAERSASWSAARSLPAQAKPLLNRTGAPTPQPPLSFRKRYAFWLFLLSLTIIGGSGALWLRRRLVSWRRSSAQPLPGSP